MNNQLTAAQLASAFHVRMHAMEREITARQSHAVPAETPLGGSAQAERTTSDDPAADDVSAPRE